MSSSLRSGVAQGGRPKQPREIAALKGELKRHPGRYKDRFAKSKQPLGKAPAHLSEVEQAIWFEIESYAIEGTIRAPQRPVMELTCILMAEMRELKREFPVAKFNALRSCLAELCLTTAQQQKLKVEEAPEDGPYAAYVG
jgi:hypothetical protein